MGLLPNLSLHAWLGFLLPLRLGLLGLNGGICVVDAAVLTGSAHEKK
jgi:hypothetical protein